MKDFIITMAVVAAITGVLAGVYIAIKYPIESYVCYSKYEDFNPTYGWFEGCRVEHDGSRIPADKLWVDLPN